MSDGLPEMADVAKVGGGLGAGGVLAVVLARLFGSNDKVLERLEGLHKELGEMKTQLAVIINGNNSRDAAFNSLQAQVTAHQRSISSIEMSIVRIESKLP